MNDTKTIKCDLCSKPAERFNETWRINSSSVKHVSVCNRHMRALVANNHRTQGK